MHKLCHTKISYTRHYARVILHCKMLYCMVKYGINYKNFMDKAVLKNIVFEVKKEALRKGCIITLPTSGKSMSPFLTTNNKVELIKYDTEKLRNGDIIIYKNSDKFIAHRLVRKIKTGDGYLFVTKGDSYLSFDRPIRSDAILGKIIKIRKANFCIPLDTVFGRLLSLVMFFLSVSKILPSAVFVLRKVKRLIKRIC